MLDRWFMSGVINHNNLIWITEIGGHIMKMNLDNYNIDYIQFNGLEECKNLSGSCAVYQEEDICYLIINKGKELVLFNEKEQTYKIVRLGLEKQNLNMIASITKLNDELLIVPMYDAHLIRINVKTGEVKYKSIIDEKINSNSNSCQYFAKSNEILNDVMWIFSTIKSQVIKYNIITDKIEYIDMPDIIGQPVHVISRNDLFYILTIQGNVYSWNIKYNEAKMIVENPTEQKENAFSIIHIVKNKLWIFPLFENDIYIYNLNSEKLEKLDSYPDGFRYNAPSCMGKYTYKIQNESRCYMAMHAGNFIFSIDEDSGEAVWINAKWPGEEYTVKYLCSNGKVNFFNPEITLDTYIDYIEKRSIEEKGKYYGIGRNIWKECKGL